MENGEQQTGTYTGTYTVNPDGSGSMSYTCAGTNCQIAFGLNSVAARQAKGAQFIGYVNKNGNYVASGTALKQ